MTSLAAEKQESLSKLVPKIRIGTLLLQQTFRKRSIPIYSRRLKEGIHVLSRNPVPHFPDGGKETLRTNILRRLSVIEILVITPPPVKLLPRRLVILQRPPPQYLSGAYRTPRRCLKQPI